MFQYERNELTECELVTMKCVWDAENITCDEVIAELKERYGLEYQKPSVYSFLNKLEKKGFITRKKRGVILFLATASEEEYMQKCLEKMKQLWFQGNTVRMLRYLYEHAKEEEKQKIIKILKEVAL